MFQRRCATARVRPRAPEDPECTEGATIIESTAGTGGKQGTRACRLIGVLVALALSPRRSRADHPRSGARQAEVGRGGPLADHPRRGQARLPCGALHDLL